MENYFDKRLKTFKRANKRARERMAINEGFIGIITGVADIEAYKKYLLEGSENKDQKAKEISKPVEKQNKQTKKETILIVDLLDCSRSMSGERIKSAKKGILQGIKSLKKEERENSKLEYEYYLMTFNSFSSYFTIVEATKVVRLNIEEGLSLIKPKGNTPLWDAIGNTLSKFMRNKNKVLVNIYTDGGENSSQQWDRGKVFDLIKNNKNITTTFVSTTKDFSIIERQLGIGSTNTMTYDGTGKGLEEALNKTVKARKDVSQGFYKAIK